VVKCKEEVWCYQAALVSYSLSKQTPSDGVFTLPINRYFKTPFIKILFEEGAFVEIVLPPLTIK
jgi:hypothetical protein